MTLTLHAVPPMAPCVNMNGTSKTYSISRSRSLL